MKSTLYVETSIVSYLTARRSRDIITSARQEITREWWKTRRTNFQLFTSEFVIEEAEEGDPEAARRRLDALAEAEELDLHDEARPLAKTLVEHGPLPAKAALDALHIAVSATSGMDYLLTWNMAHIANAAIRDQIEEICRSSGYETPIMCTPEELMEESHEG
jgi:hypothetical protein